MQYHKQHHNGDGTSVACVAYALWNSGLVTEQDVKDYVAGGETEEAQDAIFMLKYFGMVTTDVEQMPGSPEYVVAWLKRHGYKQAAKLIPERWDMHKTIDYPPKDSSGILFVRFAEAPCNLYLRSLSLGKNSASRIFGHSVAFEDGMFISDSGDDKPTRETWPQFKQRWKDAGWGWPYISGYITTEEFNAQADQKAVA